MKLQDKTLEELETLYTEVQRELARRHTLATAATEADNRARQVLDAEGLSEGDPWREPSGAHDAYPEGWEVTHNGDRWRSVKTGNMDEPGGGSLVTGQSSRHASSWDRVPE